MRTIWIIDHYSSEPEYGGISRHYDFAKELGKRGYRVVVIVSGFSHYTHQYISKKEVKLSTVAENIYYVYLKTVGYEVNNSMKRAESMVSFLAQVLRWESRIAEKYGKPDVVTGCSIHALAGSAAYRIAKKYKIRFVAEVRDFWPQVWVDSKTRKPMDPMVLFFGALEKWTYKHADRIIYTQYHGDRYICGRMGIPREKAIQIGQVMDCERYDQNREKIELIPEALREFILEGFVCAFTGYYMEYNGIYTMLEAAKILKERGLPIKMIFVGSGQEKENMLHYVKTNQLDQVLIGERIGREAVPALISRCDVCIAQAAHKGKPYVYQYGVSPLKINEYLYSGVCTLFGFPFSDNEVVESGGGLQFEPYNSEDLADKIQYVYELNQDERKEYGKRARDYYEKHHSVKVLTETLLEALFL